MSRFRCTAIAPALVLLVAACEPTTPGATLTPLSSAAPTAQALGTLAPRPSSLATVEILQPLAGATITGETTHIVLKLNGATIVTSTTTAISPDEGHVHLYVDNALVSMNYGLEQDIPVTKGTHVLKAEFVAADHAPFSPRVISAETIFTVQ